MDVAIRELGDLIIMQGEESKAYCQTTSKIKESATIKHFQISGGPVDLVIGYLIFLNGERDIRVVSVLKEFDTFGRLKHGLRLSILPIQGDRKNVYVELKQALPHAPGEKHETLHPTYAISSLDYGAKLDAKTELEKVGAIIGTKKELLGDKGKTSLHLYARFQKENLWAPIIAYTLTRVLPVRWGYKGFEI
jgi:hypothetical protein